MGRALFYLFVGLFGDVMCNYNDPGACGQPDYPAPGYAPSCDRKCRDGDGVEQTENYACGTFCFVKYSDDDDDALYYLGHCNDGKCLPDNRDADGRPPHQWDAEYHKCLDKRSETPVKNCTYICQVEKESYRPIEYYYGIYRHTGCKYGDGKTGICRSGFCENPDLFPSIDEGSIKPKE
uniref:Putative secreted salivary protein n=1 Tax=Ixodes scapularis TaxID=6945 RepID=Q4PN55_IXOSC|nr:putative secreted salivary protein [Ixodes scapularis]